MKFRFGILKAFYAIGCHGAWWYPHSLFSDADDYPITNWTYEALGIIPLSEIKIKKYLRVRIHGFFVRIIDATLFLR